MVEELVVVPAAAVALDTAVVARVPHSTALELIPGMRSKHNDSTCVVESRCFAEKSGSITLRTW